MKHLSLFSGIGGFDLAAEWMRWENVAHCEWNDFGKLVLNHHWQNSKSHDDITKTDFTIYRGRVDIVTGGFPCQPYSVAGKRKGKDDERHLWPEMLRAIREIAPRWVVGENVRGIINWDGGVVFDEVQSDLEAEGYEILPFLLPAAGVNAPHERYRTWFVAFNRQCERSEYLANRRNRIPYSLLSFGKQIEGGILDENGGRRKKGIRTYKRSTSDSNNKGNSSGFRTVSKENGEIPERNENAESCNTSTRNASYANKIRCGRFSNFCDRKDNKEKIGSDFQCEIKRLSSKQSTSNTYSTGQQKCNIYEKSNKPRYCDRLCNVKPTNWQDFPTQSPVCNGNDGFSTESLRQRIREDSMGVISEEEIDKILSSAATQWRNETIKAGGNAVVPPLVLQIFKAIQQYDLQNLPQ